MTHASLFSGIGGFDLAAEWMGWENVFHCEIDPFCQKVLKHHFPESISYESIIETDFTKYGGGGIDILTGGFPCQPYSVAGKRKGTADSRHLWPQMLRAIREIKPRYVVGENVRGLVSWDASMVFEQVCADLEAEGYEVFPVLIPACAVNAPHRRERIWFIAHSNGIGELRTDKLPRIDNKGTLQGMVEGHDSNPSHGSGPFTNPFNQVQSGLHNGTDYSRYSREAWKDFPTQSPVCGGDDGLPTELDGIAFSKWRKESIKGYGNAIVPQVAYQIFQSIQEADNLFYANQQNII